MSEKIKLLDAEDEIPFFVIYLYSFLIPKLKSLYNYASTQFLAEEKKQFSVKIGLEVIESIIKHNQLNMNDVSALYNTSSKTNKKIQIK
nr:hypothetical protein [Alkalicoccobacillus plakortidis]